MEAADAEVVRAALRSPVGAAWAADRLTGVLGVPLPRCRPRVTASAVVRLLKAGLLVHLGGDVEGTIRAAVAGVETPMPATMGKLVVLRTRPKNGANAGKSMRAR